MRWKFSFILLKPSVNCDSISFFSVSIALMISDSAFSRSSFCTLISS